MRLRTEDNKPLKLGKEYWVFEFEERFNPKLPKRMMYISLETKQYIDAIDVSGNTYGNQPSAIFPALPCAGQSSGNSYATSAPKTSYGKLTAKAAQAEEEEKLKANKITIPPRSACSNLMSPKLSVKYAVLKFRSDVYCHGIEVIGNVKVSGVFDSYDLAMESYLVKLMNCSNCIAETVELIRESLAKNK